MMWGGQRGTMGGLSGLLAQQLCGWSKCGSPLLSACSSCCWPRSGPFTRKYTITVLASSFGPWLSLALFHHLGNRWDPLDCRLVLLSGVALMVPPLALMCLFDDDKALAHQQGCQGAGRGPGRQHAVRQPDPGAQDAQSGRTPLLDGASDGLEPGLAECHGHAEAACATDSAEQEPQQSSCAVEAGSASNLGSLAQHQGSGQPRRWIRLHAGLMVALLITVSDFIGAFASGEARPISCCSSCFGFTQRRWAPKRLCTSQLGSRSAPPTCCRYDH
jgi:hypothetical protein